MARKDNPDAIELLKQDHREVEALFSEFKKTSGEKTKEKIALKICTELKIHAIIEEEIFYPAIRGKVEDADLDEALVEHDGAKMLINEIEASGSKADFFDAKVKVLKEEIEHHIKEEEKQWGSLFSQARKTDVDMDALGAQMAERKAELQELARTKGLPPAEMATMEQA
jgi:hemerythrin superfamily protein